MIRLSRTSVAWDGSCFSKALTSSVRRSLSLISSLLQRKRTKGSKISVARAAQSASRAEKQTPEVGRPCLLNRLPKTRSRCWPKEGKTRRRLARRVWRKTTGSVSARSKKYQQQAREVERAKSASRVVLP